jgi:CDP-glycerol glycerophosphotransferase (TagB/SpsB family)
MLTRLRQSRAARIVVRRVGVHRVTLVLGLVQLPAIKATELVLARIARDRHLVVLGAPLDRFSDNAAYMYVHLSEKQGALRPVWISGSSEVVERLRARGYRAETRWSWRGVLSCLRAGTFVYSSYRSDINRWLSPGATTLCLWHGLPIKRVEASAGSSTPRRKSWFERLIEAGREAPPDYLLTSSDFVTEAFSHAFGVPPEHCWEHGYPRNDHLVANPRNPPAALLWHEDERDRMLSARFTVGLFLTWRDEKVDDAVDAELVQRLAETCGRHGSVLAYKAHYNVAPTAVLADDCVLLPPDADLHAYLGYCDVLVTDYSSVALDFLLMRRPVVYFMPDMEHYAATRGFQVDPLALPGVVTREPEALLGALDEILADPTSWSWKAADDTFLRMMWGDYTGSAGEAIESALLASADRSGVTRREATYRQR